ncbi:hypothetical protein HJC23_004947 [Cyclotella cryptica]|uniref:UDENN domain-containing protein n=1 Tax=Cyclotella cryptica TaxID=29204 RepID=A0ABD3PXX0_9STRA
MISKMKKEPVEVSGKHKTRMGQRVKPIQHNINDGSSDRLVEYFVVVSTRQCKPDRSHDSHSETALPAVADAQTKARLNTRRAHMPGEDQINANLLRLSSIAGYSTSSTSSTCSSEENGLHLRGDFGEIPTRRSTRSTVEPNASTVLPPQGTDVLRASTEYKMPRIHHFVLTDSNAGKLFGTCLTFYEEFVPDEPADNRTATLKKTLYAPRVLCLLSTWPYLMAFRTYLTQLYRLATTTDLMQAPIERYILNICEEVPAPQPGAFAVQLSILGSNVRFWAPPAKQPIAYVSLPFKVLFECLDISNLMYTWYSLACERKVLLVSEQMSLLAVCAEILCSLLFPMRWSHLYIPLLPLSLSPMLDAPMPYLCGISRDNFECVVGDIGDETVVVDLDRNVITLGPDTPALPPIPHKQRVKLESALQKNVGDVFWNARGMSQDEVSKFRRSGNNAEIKEMHSNARSLWSEKIRAVDDAFNLAHAPESTSIQYNEDARVGTDALGKQSRWDAVQEAFLSFYAETLKNYRKFLPKESSSRINWRGHNSSKLRFQAEQFVLSQRREFQPFLEELVSTQQFDDFITRRIYNSSDEPDVIFFDKSIDAKKNKNILQVKKADTTFLHSANAHRELHQYTAILPNREDIPPNPHATIASHGYRVYKYPAWPETFDTSMFCSPRPFPKDIAAEFKRTITLSGGRFFVVPRDPFEDYHEENESSSVGNS